MKCIKVEVLLNAKWHNLFYTHLRMHIEDNPHTLSIEKQIGFRRLVEHIQRQKESLTLGKLV